MRGVDVVAEILKAEGVEFLSCFPMNQIIDSAAAAGIRPVVSRTERVVVNIADGFSRMNSGKKMGIAALQYGPGAEGAFGSVAHAFSDASPVLCLSGSYASQRLSVPPNFKPARNFRHVTKWAETVNNPAWIPDMMRRAFALMRNGKPGPVMLEIPSDVLMAEYPGGSVDYQPVRPSRPSGNADDVREAIEALLAAKTPVIVAGQGALYAEAWDELLEFAELVQVPVMSTLNGKSVFPENHPLALGAANGFSRPKMVDHFLEKADLVFGIGTSFTKSIFITPIPAGKKIVQVSIDESDIGKDYSVAIPIIGDAKAVLKQMIAEAHDRLSTADRRERKAIVDEVKEVKDAYLAEWMPRLTSDEEPINPYRVIWELMHMVDRTRTVITHDSGNPRDQIVPIWEAIVPHGYLGWGKSTPLGAGLGLIMGAKLAKPDWLAINLMGDTAFGMVGMDFETAVRNEIPILTVLMNNGVMGDYSKKHPIATEKYGVNRLTGDYARVADALGGYSERVERVADLKAAFERGIAVVETGRPALLEIITAEDPAFPGG